MGEGGLRVLSGSLCEAVGRRNVSDSSLVSQSGRTQLVLSRSLAETFGLVVKRRRQREASVAR